jgi:hypothetical protein
LLSELGSSKKASDTADLSSLRPRSKTSNQSTRRADRARNEVGERREGWSDLRVHASDPADVLEEEGGGAQHQDGHLRTRGGDMA